MHFFFASIFKAKCFGPFPLREQCYFVFFSGDDLPSAHDSLAKPVCCSLAKLAHGRGFRGIVLRGFCFSPKSRFVSFVAQEYACGPSWEYAGSAWDISLIVQSTSIPIRLPH